MDKRLTVLKQVFGHTDFRPGQEALTGALLAGRDALGVMPTGAGKSACYQIPALLLDGVALVISPLISLMKDQVAALTQAGAAAAFINSSLSEAQMREVFRRAEMGLYKIIYLAPERLGTADFFRFASQTPVSLVAVDEAHCASQWGQDFRPSYLKIAEFIDRLPCRPAVGAFTATATAEVKEDIVRLLGLREPLRVTTGFDRPNLHFDVIRPKDKTAYINAYLARRGDQSGIVYCATRRAADAVCAGLRSRGIAAAPYHAGLDDAERRQNQEDFLCDRVRVMVATNAFGMGIDKSNVGFVLHYNMPKNLESYYQEAGRAGRDGEPAGCVLLFSNGDIQTAKYLIQNSEDNEELSEQERRTIRTRDYERLDRMVGYCQTARCLRAYILAYFGERRGDGCGNCGNCGSAFEQRDITVEAQKILSCVARVEKRFDFGLGVTLFVRMLHGSKDQRVKQLRLEEFPTYGLLRGTDRKTIRGYIDHLAAEGYLFIEGEEYPVLRLTGKAGDVLFRGGQVSMPVRIEEKTEPPGKARVPIPARLPGDMADDTLFDALKALRLKLAREANVAAFVVFSNAALRDMASRQPRTMAAFLEVSGVGEVKAARYGEAFLAVIREHVS